MNYIQHTRQKKPCKKHRERRFFRRAIVLLLYNRIGVFSRFKYSLRARGLHTIFFFFFNIESECFYKISEFFVFGSFRRRLHHA